MGYMGFGMRKADWERKPKEAFKKAKDLYGSNLESFPKTAAPEELVSTDFAELARLREQHKQRFHFGAVISKMVFGIGMVLLLLLLYYATVKGLDYP